MLKLASISFQHLQIRTPDWHIVIPQQVLNNQYAPSTVPGVGDIDFL